MADQDRDTARARETEQALRAGPAPGSDGRLSPEADEPVDGAGTIGRVADLGRDLGRDIGSYIRLQRSHAKISLRQLSRLAGVSNPYLSQIERGLRRPSAEILQQIAKGLRISAEALYEQAGILDRPVGGPVAEALRADTDLTERQKQVLLDIYDSFRRENEGAGRAAPDTDPVGPGATGSAP